MSTLRPTGLRFTGNICANAIFSSLVGFSDLLGVPNPVSFYTLELYPELIEQFHEWHQRMGMEQAPEGGFRCC